MVLRLPLISHSVGILGNFVLGLLTFGNRSTFVTMEQEMCDHRGCDDSVSTNCKLQQETEQGLGISNGVAGDDNYEAVRVMPLEGKPTVNRGDEESEVSNNGVPSVGEGDEESEVGNSGVVFKKQSNVVEAPKMEVVEGLEKQSCVIDIKVVVERLAEKKDQEKVCRICHLSAEQSDEDAMSTELILLGCNCKDELGITHVHCAESWFKLKGNRLCEICGQTAKNITGIRANRFMEQWEVRRVDDINTSDEGERCWRGQPFCNFLMACLVFAFVLPWFFRVNMF